MNHKSNNNNNSLRAYNFEPFPYSDYLNVHKKYETLQALLGLKNLKPKED